MVDGATLERLCGRKSTGGSNPPPSASIFRLCLRGQYHFVGQFCLVSDYARRAVKDTKTPEARRDLTFGGIGLSLDF